MLNMNHPDDVRLSALASQDADAVADASLVRHVESCERCASMTEELGALRATLATLPDLAPPRALRLVPEAAPAGPPDRLGEWVRKVFGPVMAAGAAIALVGMVGTVAPSFAGSGALTAGQADMASEGAVEVQRSSNQAAAPGGESLYSDGGPRETVEDGGAVAVEPEPGDTDEMTPLDAAAERSPWPMVLFTGVALLIAAALLRWIVVPRAG
jgi:hypothetical protein